MQLNEFAKIGSEHDLDKKLLYLKHMAEREVWDINDPKYGVFILKKYIYLTFDRCYEQFKILYSKDKEHCAINTGLLTDKDSKDILMVFDKNYDHNELTEYGAGEQEWYFGGFKIPTDRDYMNNFGNNIPEMATYAKDVKDLYFNPELKVELDLNHIVDDNWERVSSIVRFPKEVVRMMMSGALESTLKRIRRNFKLAIPQFYNDQIGFFLPLEFPTNINGEYVTLALAVEKVGKMYRANTIFSLNDAYVKARRVMQIDTNWLLG